MPLSFRLPSVLVLGLSLGMALLAGAPFADDPVEGTVREALSGNPIASARVELRSGSQILATARTDREGAFRLEPRESWSEGWEVHVIRLGYASASLSVPAARPRLELVLDPVPLPLPAFQVEGEGRLCERSEDREARELWRLAAERHAGGLDTLGIASYILVRTDTLGSGSGDDLSAAGAGPGQRASAPLLRMSWNRRVEREGYAFPVRRSDRLRSYDSWSYPPLEADFAPHFAHQTFGRLHDFHMEQADATGWVVRFCGRRTNGPFLEGVLEIGSDTLIHRVEWRFHTPDPDESAGGWSRFLPPSGGGSAPPLLPTESMTWRSLPDDRIVRRAQWYEEWKTAPGDSVPFLPERNAGDGP